MLPDTDVKQSDETPPEAAQPEKRLCTAMFYFASDNPLAPSIVSQLKAIKDAGFHKQVNVIARFDPHDGTTAPHIFDVNIGEKAESKADFNIGFDSRNPFVRTLVLDKLWSETDDEAMIRQEVLGRIGKRDDEVPKPEKAKLDMSKGRPVKKLSTEPSPFVSLTSFLAFCAKHYPAQHYMLFILGHGIIVGNELFLFDEHTDDDNARSLTLAQLRECLNKFTKDVGEKKPDGTTTPKKLDLVSFHSCSMSGLEVAYELQDEAKYMLASEGPAFVGSWPYRQILVGLFNRVQEAIEGNTEFDVTAMVRRMFAYCFFNSYDFQLAGYSFDLCLTDLERVGDQSEVGIKAALKELVRCLCLGLSEGQAVAGRPSPTKAALANMARDLIILSHWQSQSYFEENFTDLGDFCFCLKRRCEDAQLLLPNKLPPSIDLIRKACEKVLTVLACNKPEYEDSDPEGDRIRNATPIIKHAFAGPAYQYSNGLSLYFPWSLPEDNQMWDEQYGAYRLSEDTGWKGFLEDYFLSTKRVPQARERRNAKLHVEQLTEQALLLEKMGTFIFNEFGQLKDLPSDRTGGDCNCSSIKNYPRSTRGDETDNTSPGALNRLNIIQS